MREPSTFIALSFFVFIFLVYKKNLKQLIEWLNKPAEDLRQIFFSNREILKKLSEELEQEKIKNDNISIEIEKIINLGKEKLDLIEKKLNTSFNEHLKSKKNKNDSIIENIKLEFKKEIYFHTVDRVTDEMIKYFEKKRKESGGNFLDLSIASKIIMQEKNLKQTIYKFIEKS